MRFAYDRQFEPAAPVLPLRVGHPAAAPTVLLWPIVDTGADLTLLPEELVTHLGLPRVDARTIQGVGGVVRDVPVHAALLQLGQMQRVVRVAALGEEALIGRDLLPHHRLTLDGPHETLELSFP